MRALRLRGVLLVLACAAPLPLGGSGRGEPAPAAPSVELEAQPRLGFRPLQVALTGTLRNVSRENDNFCHVDQVWSARRANEPASRERASARRPRCQHPPEERRVELRFYKEVTLATPGVYVYRLQLEPKDGHRLTSNPVTIQVLAKP